MGSSWKFFFFSFIYLFLNDIENSTNLSIFKMKCCTGIFLSRNKSVYSIKKVFIKVNDSVESCHLFSNRLDTVKKKNNRFIMSCDWFLHTSRTLCMNGITTIKIIKILWQSLNSKEFDPNLNSFKYLRNGNRILMIC